MSNVETHTQAELGDLLGNSLSKNKIYLDALDVTRKNSSGKIWLIGSGVYKTLLNILYERDYDIKDWDLVIEKIITPLNPGNDWEIAETKHGNPKLKKDNLVIDLIALDNVHSIKERNLEPNINHYLNGTPLTIQAIAFDVDDNNLLGEMGMQSILTKTVGINHKAEYDYAMGIYGNWHTPERYAKIFGFKIV